MKIHLSKLESGQVTRILADIAGGRQEAKEELMRIVYDELHKLAASKMRSERPGHTLQPTALVHETYLRLFPEEELCLNAHNHRQFLGIAAHAMREVLIDHARKREAKKRGGDRQRIVFDDLEDGLDSEIGLDIVKLGESLRELETFSRRQSEIVTLRYFGGLAMREIAESLKCSLSTVEKDWMHARAWLSNQF